MLDLALALALLVLTSPLVLIFGGLVKATSRGPMIYSQIRAGRDGEPFTIYKLRTMVQDAEKQGAQWAMVGDPRVTPLGRFMRKVRIDELPQLWNILKGDMSFIGPRPERPEFHAQLDAQIPFFGLRLLVKPGLTGWAQVNFPYGSSVEDAKRKLEYDLYYIKHQTLGMDLQVVARTLRVVLSGFGGR